MSAVVGGEPGDEESLARAQEDAIALPDGEDLAGDGAATVADDIPRGEIVAGFKRGD